MIPFLLSLLFFCLGEEDDEEFVVMADVFVAVGEATRVFISALELTEQASPTQPVSKIGSCWSSREGTGRNVKFVQWEMSLHKIVSRNKTAPFAVVVLVLLLFVIVC